MVGSNKHGVVVFDGAVEGYEAPWDPPASELLIAEWPSIWTSGESRPLNQYGNLVLASAMARGITVTSPNGGESWRRGTTHTITWSKSGTTGSYVKIELLKSGVVNRVITSSTANDGYYSWTIPSIQTAGTTYKIRITSTTFKISDSSNSNFAITI